MLSLKINLRNSWRLGNFQEKKCITKFMIIVVHLGGSWANSCPVLRKNKKIVY